MTARDDDGKAVAWFTAIMTVVAGGAGLAVAGLIVGLDYAINGGPEERKRVAADRATRRRERYDEALAWLEADRADRSARRHAYAAWMKKDPTVRGDTPSRSTSESLGHVFAWMTNSAIVAGGRFMRGWRSGRTAAQERRQAGEPIWWLPRDNRTAPKQATNPRPDPDPTPPPASATENPTAAPNGDIIDGEVIDDPQPGSRQVVRVGEDTPTSGGLGVEHYDDRLAELAREMVNDPRRPVDPSPPATALTN
jgi:hypothetical protein